MGDDDDDDLLAAEAATFIKRHGPSAVPRLREHEEIARGLGHELSADAWSDIAMVAADSLGFAGRSDPG